MVLLAYGAGEEHGPLFRTLTREGVAPEQIVLVHNPSEPGQAPPPVPAGCEVLATGRNLGYAAAMNLGIERQLRREPSLLLVATHDARLRPGALAAMTAAAEADPRYGALGPVLLFGGSEEPFSFGGTTSRGGALGHRTEPPPGGAGVAECDWVDGGTMLMRAEVLSRIGGFDERLWGYCEDADLCLRVKRAGYGVGVVVAARADQAPGGSKRPGAWAYLLTRNGIAYARRFAGRRGLLAATGRALGRALLELARTAARASGLRSGPAAERWAVAAGTLRGLADYFAGRWGPPPPSLPGIGDVKNAEPSGGGTAAEGTDGGG